MIKTTLAVSAIALVMAFSTVRAQAATECTEAEMAKMETETGKVTDAAMKAKMMEEMKMAKEMMGKKDLAGCATHMDNAMKMMPKT